MATCEDGIRTRGAGRVRGPCFCARKTRGNRGNIGIAPPPEYSMLEFCPKWRLAVDVGANGGKCHRERGERWPVLTSAVVVPVDDAAAARPPPPAKAVGVAAMLMGATTHGL